MQEWLQCRSDVMNVRYVGDEGEGPPDFLAEFHGVEVAIEVTKMPLNTGWPEEQRVAFEEELQQVVRSVKDNPEAPRWHVLCFADERQPRPPKRNGDWKEQVRDALLRESSGGELQLMSESKRVGEGVVVKYLPAGNDGSLPFVNQGGAYSLMGSASARILEEVHAKAVKVRQSERAQRYSHWWLILDDEVVNVPNMLTTEEWRHIRDAVATSEHIALWSKVILISRYTGDCTAVYERSGQRELGEGLGADAPEHAGRFRARRRYSVTRWEGTWHRGYSQRDMPVLRSWRYTGSTG